MGLLFGITDWAEKQTLDYWWLGSALTLAGPLFVRLLTSATTPVATNEDISSYTEVSGSGYPAGGVSLAGCSSGAVAGGITNDLLTIDFGPATGTWTGIRHVVLVDSGTNKIVAAYDRDSDLVITSGQTYRFPLSSLAHLIA